MDKVNAVIVDQLLFLEEEEIGLRIVGSKVIDSKEARDLRQLFALVIMGFWAKTEKKAPSEVEKMLAKLAGQLELELRNVTRSIEEEIRATL